MPFPFKIKSTLFVLSLAQRIILHFLIVFQKTKNSSPKIDASITPDFRYEFQNGFSGIESKQAAYLSFIAGHYHWHIQYSGRFGSFRQSGKKHQNQHGFFG